MSKFFPLRLIALAIGAMFAAIWFTSQVAAFETCCGPEEGPSWIFAPGTYTHDPMTGARVAQYERVPPVEPLEDERNVTSSYRRTRTVLRGADGSSDTYYQVQAWGNGRGGLDAEWERVNDAWKQAYITGGYYSSQGGPYGYGYGQGYGYGGWGPGNGGPGWAGGPGWNNGGNWNGPPNGWGGIGNGPSGPGGWNGPGNSGPPGGGNQGGNGPHSPQQGDVLNGPGQQGGSQQGNWHHGNHGQNDG
ncbi:MAG TPA: hypothetical protein VGM76_00680 [Lacipirellulaceae bacterium]|jgi:hypothetical protein